MKDALENENWNSVGLAAIHCAISATDALLCRTNGIRAITDDHREAADLLKQYIGADGTKDNSKRLLKILGMKNLIEYEARNFTYRDAASIAKETDRYFDWIKSIIELSYD
jgi:hypothetical protein